MSSAKYAGYLSGAAVAAGIGAALAVGAQGTAHAEAEDSGPQKPASVSKVEKKLAKVPKGPAKAANVESKVREAASSASAGSKSAVKKFDASEAVRDLKRGFDKTIEKVEKAEAKTQQRLATAATALSDRTGLLTKASETARSLNASRAVVAQVDAGDPSPNKDALLTNPFRDDDPDPGAAEMFGPALELRDAIRSVNPIAELDPFIREGFEAGYRVSQMIPWVNLPIPLLQLSSGTHGNQQLTQAAVNQLLLTLPPVGILYYGYDQVADLLNVEEAAAELKDEFFSTVWGIDFVGLLHNPGDSGLPVNRD